MAKIKKRFILVDGPEIVKAGLTIKPNCYLRQSIKRKKNSANQPLEIMAKIGVIHLNERKQIITDNMNKEFNDTELRALVEDLNELKAIRLQRNRKQNIATDVLIDKAIRILTRQPEPIPYCNCNDPKWCHDFPRTYCKICYGVPASFKQPT